MATFLTPEDYLYLKHFEQISARFPYHHKLELSNLYCIIYTSKGSGKLVYNDDIAIPLDTDSLLFTEINHPCTLKGISTLWNFDLYIFSGTLAECFFHKNASYKELIVSLPKWSNLATVLFKNSLQLQNSSQDTLVNFQLLSNLLTELILFQQTSTRNKNSVPTYLYKIKYKLETEYANDYSLDTLGKEFHMSKYKIAKEFSQFFGEPPITFLNRHRIEISKSLLIHSDKPVYEISNQVGFNTPSHFIRLFKTQTSLTPNQYRNQERLR